MGNQTSYGIPKTVRPGDFSINACPGDLEVRPIKTERRNEHGLSRDGYVERRATIFDEATLAYLYGTGMMLAGDVNLQFRTLMDYGRYQGVPHELIYQRSSFGFY